MKLKKLDMLHIAALILSCVGIVLEVLGGTVFAPVAGIGANFNFSAMMLVGIVMTVIALVLSIVGSVCTEKQGLNKQLSTIALFVSILAVMFTVYFVAYTIIWPILHPVNG